MIKFSSLMVRVFITFVIGLSLLFWGYLLFLWERMPSEAEIRSPCLRARMHDVELCENKPGYVRLSAVPKHFISILLLSEDSSFWSHQGFDWDEIKNSLQQNWEKGYYARGGSTISQQLARNLFLNKNKTLHRKLMEALITLRLEKTLTKRQILEKYINVVQFGRDLFGLSQATRYYFNKSVSDLEPAESAFLVMLLPNPEKYSRSFYQKKLTRFAHARIKTLLQKAHKANALSEEEYQASLDRLANFFRAPN